MLEVRQQADCEMEQDVRISIRDKNTAMSVTRNNNTVNVNASLARNSNQRQTISLFSTQQVAKPHVVVNLQRRLNKVRRNQSSLQKSQLLLQEQVKC